MILCLVNKKSAHLGFIAHPAILVVGGIIVLVIIGIASGALKFSGSLKYNPSKQQSTNTPNSSSKQNQTAKINLSETYTHTSPNYSIGYPTDWAIAESGKVAAIYSKAGGATTTQQSEAGVMITTSSLGQLAGSKLSTIADLSKPQLQKEFPGATISSEEDVKVGTYDAHVFNMVYPNNGIDWQGKFYVLTDADNLYGLVATANKPKWSNYEAALQAIVNSFKLSQ